MHFATHEPSSALSPYVQSIIHYKHFMPDHSIERVVPDGHIHLIFELDGFERNTFDNKSLKPIAKYTRVWLAGPHKHYISISAHENSEMFVIRFKPGGLHPFMDNSVSDVNDKVIPAQQLFGENVLMLREDLLEASEDDKKMFALAEAFLIGIAIFKESSARTLVEHILQAIHKNSASQLQTIVSQAGYSQKQAIHVFKQYVGLNPKTYQRIVRFNEILLLIMEKKSIAWRDICADCYYYDQSHFIREFKAFCGYSPQEFLVHQGEHPEPNFFPLDQQDAH